MKNYTVRLYSNNDFELWNDFVSKAKNATFLFHRNFMEYHKDRFEDYSMMVFYSDDLVSIIPANRVGDEVFSHQGLTYGGFVLGEKTTLDAIPAIYNAVLDFLVGHRIALLQVKEIPFFYDNATESVEKTILYKNGTKIIRKNTFLGIDLNSDFSISKSKLKHYKRLLNSGLLIEKENGFDCFWQQVLTPLLHEKYGVSPVHSLTEITLLKKLFENNIEQYSVYLDNEILAGITIFKTTDVIKSQYGAVTENGKKYRALDFLFIHLIEKFKNSYRFFDMGTVDDDSESGINQGLLNQKKELGCEAYNQNIFQIVL